MGTGYMIEWYKSISFPILAEFQLKLEFRLPEHPREHPADASHYPQVFQPVVKTQV